MPRVPPDSIIPRAIKPMPSGTGPFLLEWSRRWRPHLEGCGLVLTASKNVDGHINVTLDDVDETLLTFNSSVGAAHNVD